MNPAAVLTRLQSAGVLLYVSEGDLRFRAPRGVYTPELRAEVAAHRTELAAMIEFQERGWSSEDAELLAWFSTAKLPIEPFRLLRWIEVMDPILFYARLQGDIEDGPAGRRAALGALQSDLRALREYVIAGDRLDCELGEDDGTT